MDRVKVEWKIEGGEIKGRILEDEKARRKIVFVGRDFRGRRPNHGEVTEAHVFKDTKPDEKNKGALLVSPVYPPDPKAVTEDQFREMIELGKVPFGLRLVVENIRFDSCWNGVVGDVALVGGTLRYHSEMFAYAEQLWAEALIMPAYIIEGAGQLLTTEQRELTATLLRRARHTLGWHRVHFACGSIGMDGTAHRLWSDLIKIERFFTSPFAPPSLAQEGLDKLVKARDDIAHSLTLTYTFHEKGDPLIYDGSEPDDDSAETERLNEQVLDGLRAVDAKIEHYRSEIVRIGSRLDDPSLLECGRKEVEKLHARYQAVSRNRKFRASSMLVQDMRDREHACGFADNTLDGHLRHLYSWLTRCEQEISQAEKSD